jgi:hypothetical protein
MPSLWVLFIYSILFARHWTFIRSLFAVMAITLSLSIVKRMNFTTNKKQKPPEIKSLFTGCLFGY